MIGRDPRVDPRPGDWTCFRGSDYRDQHALVIDRTGDSVVFIDEWGHKGTLGIDDWLEYSIGDEVLYVSGT